MDKQILNAIKNLEKRVVDLYYKVKIGNSTPGPIGPQGVQGTAGLPGPIGPAGLNWQGSWTSGVSYITDDAVGYGGASYFCILATSGITAPDLDTTHWALLASQGAEGPTGVQGPTGAQGIPGSPPWTFIGAYDNGVSYNLGSAVTFQGGFYYRTGNPLNPGYPPTPGSINASWTPVADRGEVGPAGTAPVKTKGQLYGSVTTYQTQTLLTYDINLINDGSESSFFKLPDTLVPGKEVIVDVMGSNCWIYGFNGGLAFETAVNGSNSQIITKFNDLIKFTSIGFNFWIVEYLSRNSVTLNGKNLDNSPGIYTFTTNSTTSPISLVTLNSTYINFSTILDFKVYCPNISGGGLVYVKTGVATWISYPITSVV